MLIHTDVPKNQFPSLSRHEPMAIDSSAMMSFKFCPRQYFFRYVLGYTLKEEAVYFTFGKAYHKFREHLEILWAKEPDKNKYVNYIVEAQEEALKVWGKTPDPTPGTDFDFQTRRRLIESCVAASKEWIKEKNAGHYKVLQTEQAFNVEVAPGIFSSGRFDQVVMFLGRLWGRDFKTTKVKKDFYIRQFEPNDQFTRYTHAQTELHGKPVAGQIVDVLWNAKPDKSGKQNGPLVYPHMVPIPEARIQQWKKDQVYWDAALRACRESDMYPMNEKGCTWCQFRQVCTQPSENVQLYTLQQKYKHQVWDNSNPED